MSASLPTLIEIITYEICSIKIQLWLKFSLAYLQHYYLAPFVLRGKNLERENMLDANIRNAMFKFPP